MMRHAFLALGLSLAFAAGCDDDKDAATDTVVDTNSDSVADDTTTEDTDITEDTAGAVDTTVEDSSGPDSAMADTTGDTADDEDTVLLEDTAADTTAESDTTMDDTTDPPRTNLILRYCGGADTATTPGAYRGTTAGGLNDFSESACGGTAFGADGSVRVEVGAGETLTATYISTADGILYILDNCPVFGSCLDRSDGTGEGGVETVSWTNTAGTSNAVHLILDNDDDGEFLPDGGTFTLDIAVTAP
ncbi:MAG: hypothetical protein ACI9MR_000958 [Myxococcota bacterium]|jgi:hypothetical protein